MDQHTVLKRYFGHTQFRPGQETLISGILGGRDVLGVMPTGGGKSLCYQVPALLLTGISLVISPLISLMKGQVAALREAGVDAAFLNSSLSGDQLRQVYRRVRQGAYKLVYIAPERLDGEGFTALARELDISLVAVDEAHCVSQWGQDFRPSYLRITEFMEKLPRRPVVAAFTATATGEVRRDIAAMLGLADPVEVVTGFDRPNLFFDVRRPGDKSSALAALVEERRDRSGIIYCATRSKVDRVCRELCDRGIGATRYHAGLSDGERRQNQDDFQFDRRPVMVATNAFGMGIDKSNVSFVIHYNMPKSLEAYYQEAGRAGRDGEPADCILLYSAGDVTTAKFLIENSGENGALSPAGQALARGRDYQRLEAMVNYCQTTDCLRGCILDYFGQAHGEVCASCGNCRGEFVPTDITIPAQMILSCVRRIKDRLGYHVGATLVVNTLRGSGERRVLELGLDGLPTYGLMKEVPRAALKVYLEHLETRGYLTTDPRHGGLETTAKASQVLFHGEKVVLPLRADRGGEPERRRKRGQAAPLPAGDGGLLSALKAVRNQLAQEENVPAYIVFSNAALADMAARVPQTAEEFLEVSGVGQVKAARYGAVFLKVIADYLDSAGSV